MTRLQNKDLMIKMVGERIVQPEAQVQTMNKILESLPESILADDRAAGLDDEAIADKHFDTWKKGQTGAGETDPSQKKTGKPTSSTMTAEEIRMVDDLLNENAVSKSQKSANTKLVCVLTDKPTFASLYVQGSALTPKLPEKPEEYLKKLEEKLVDTPDNLRNFAEAKAAWLAGENMSVYINENAREKVIGFKVSTLDENGTPTVRILDKEEAMVFLTYEVNGSVPPTSENSIGIRLRWRERKTSLDATGKVTPGLPMVVVVNSKVLKATPSLSECTSIATEETTNVAAKSAKMFVIDTGNKNSEGKAITRKTRLPGTTVAKVVKRSNEYLAKFGKAGSRKDSAGMTKKERENNMMAVRNAMNLLYSGVPMNSPYAREIQSAIRKKLGDARKQASGDVQ